MARTSDWEIRDGQGRGLASRAARWFSATTIVKAQDYANEGSVKLVEVATRTVVARVQGSARRPYLVNVAAPITARGVLRIACSCPMGERADPCKHVYATLLVLDRRGIDLRLEAERARVDVVVPWVSGPEARIGWDELPDVGREQEAGVSAAGVRPVRTVAVEPAAPRPLAPPPRSWADRLRWLASDDPAAPRLATDVDFEFQLASFAPVGAHGEPRDLPEHLEVTTFERARRKDGGPGRRAVRVLRFDGNDPVSDERDHAAVTALALGNRPDEDAVPGGRSSPYRPRPQRVIAIPSELVDRIVPALAATGHLGWTDPIVDDREPTLHRLAWDGERVYRLTLSIKRDGDGLTMTAALDRDGHRSPLGAITMMLGASCAALEGRLVRVEPGEDLARWWAIAGAAPLTVPRGQVSRFVEQLAAVSRLPAIEFDAATGWSLSPVVPTPHLVLSPTDGSYHGQVSFEYAGVRRRPIERAALLLDPIGQVLRPVDREAEAARLAELRAIAAVRPLSLGELALEPRDLAALATALEPTGWQLWLRDTRVRTGGRLKASVSTGIDWLDVGFDAEIGDMAVDGVALIEALRAGRNLVRLRDGSHGLVPTAWIEQHAALAQQGAVVDGVVRVPRSRALVLDLLLEALPVVDRDASFRRLRARLANFAGIKPHAEPKGFAGELRPYQRDGLGWLAFLRELGFGGCLADDMGLGKTVQVLAAIVESRRGRGPKRPTLVVAPKSVVWNWVDEAARFAPGLKVFDHGGPDRRRRLAELDRADLVVTSYATMRLDIELLAARTFDYVVLDEAQAIKNPEAQVARAARLLKGEHRLALTGTPVENHLGDLASIFEFLNPGMLDGVAALRRLGDRDGELAPLGRALRPFLLRRTKGQVLPELPARSEQVLKVKLEGAQRRFYDQLREGYRASLLSRVARDGMARSTMHVLEALLRLRQAACAPQLVSPERAKDGSAKLDLLIEQLVEVSAEGHKVLVFSQFTSLLALVRTRLDEAGLVHEYLDGQTRDRKARVARFQSDAGCQVFLLSLKAGGTGLNLTAASYVYLLDPWWNPAVEAQAIDRTHRLGQTRAVTAYRLIAEDTVEDKILELQHQKRALLEGLFAEDAGRMASLTSADLELLLAP